MGSPKKKYVVANGINARSNDTKNTHQAYPSEK
jgi:hypothetical protein